jgi:hypothetical protein
VLGRVEARRHDAPETRGLARGRAARGLAALEAREKAEGTGDERNDADEDAKEDGDGEEGAWVKGILGRRGGELGGAGPERGGITSCDVRARLRRRVVVVHSMGWASFLLVLLRHGGWRRRGIAREQERRLYVCPRKEQFRPAAVKQDEETRQRNRGREKSPHKAHRVDQDILPSSKTHRETHRRSRKFIIRAVQSFLVN